MAKVGLSFEVRKNSLRVLQTSRLGVGGRTYLFIYEVYAAKLATVDEL